jgi:hypothetical protein
MPVELLELIGAGAGPAKAIIDKLIDPTLNTALGPPAGLQVSPAVFQSVEQEGRWKPRSLVDAGNNGRIFELANHAEAASPPEPQLAERYGGLVQHQATLFTIEMPGIATEGELLALVTKFVLGNTQSAITAFKQLVKDDVCTLTVDAIWWADGLEIFAGYAGLATATGFGSVFNTTANVTLQAIPFGNYYPAAALVSWAGWVNPIGPGFWEFQGATVLTAAGDTSGSLNQPRPEPAKSSMRGVKHLDLGTGQPAYMWYWNRSQGERKPLRWSPATGFKMSYGSLETGEGPAAMRGLLGDNLP